MTACTQKVCRADTKTPCDKTLALGMVWREML